LSGNEEFAKGETLAGHAAGGTLQRQGERSVGVGLVGDPGAGEITGEQPRGLAWRRGESRVFHGNTATVVDGKLGRLQKLRPRVVATVDLASGVFFGVSVPAQRKSAKTKEVHPTGVNQSASKHKKYRVKRFKATPMGDTCKYDLPALLSTLEQRVLLRFAPDYCETGVLPNWLTDRIVLKTHR